MLALNTQLTVPTMLAQVQKISKTKSLQKQLALNTQLSAPTMLAQVQTATSGKKNGFFLCVCLCVCVHIHSQSLSLSHTPPESPSTALKPHELVILSLCC